MQNNLNIFKIKFLFIVFFINFNNAKSYLIFPLEYLQKENYNIYQDELNNNTPEKIFQQIYYKNLITKIKIGKEQKNHIFFIETNTHNFYISSVNPPKIAENEKQKQINYYKIPENELFNEELSISYKENYCKKALQNINHYIEICFGKEQITFKNGEKSFIKDFPVKIVKNHDDNIPGKIGLLVNDTLYNYSRSLITELKSENLINNYYWFFDIDEISILNRKIKANLIIGGLPHEILPQKYSEENYRTQTTYTVPYIFEAWRFKFDKIYTEGNSIQLENAIVTLSYEFYNIIGSTRFHDIIKGLFLNELIKDKKCFYSKFPQNIVTNYNMTFYYCDKSVKDILYKNIPGIKFFSFVLSHIFELTEEELFFIREDYIYFNILFCEKGINYWTLGQLFTTKYNFVFNTDKKQIGFYQKVNKNINNKSESEKINNINFNNKSNKSLIIFLIISGIIFTCIGIIIGKKIFGFRRKVIVNELIEEQNYDYRVNNNINKENNIESNYKPIGNKKDSIIEMTKKFD